MTAIITTTRRTPLAGTESRTGRPVEFSTALWAWVFADTPGEEAVEYVRGPVRVVRAAR